MKGQVGVETLVVLGVLVFLSTIVLFSLNERNVNVEGARQHLSAERETGKVASAINDAALSGEGFRTNVTVSVRAGGREATYLKVLPLGRRVEMKWQGPRNDTRVASSNIITSGVSSASLSTGLVSVNNTGDKVEVKCWNDAKTKAETC